MFLSLSLVFLSLLLSPSRFSLSFSFSLGLCHKKAKICFCTMNITRLWTDFDAFVRTRTGENSRGEGDGGKVVYVREGRGEGM